MSNLTEKMFRMLNVPNVHMNDSSQQRPLYSTNSLRERLNQTLHMLTYSPEGYLVASRTLFLYNNLIHMINIFLQVSDEKNLFSKSYV